MGKLSGYEKITGGTLRCRIEGPLMQHDENSCVSSLRTNRTWTFDSLHVSFPPQIEKLIKGIPVAHIARLSDIFIWPHHNGTCLVSLTSKFLYQHQQVPWNKQLWNWIWKLQCPKKIQKLQWKAMRNWLSHEALFNLLPSKHK